MPYRHQHFNNNNNNNNNHHHHHHFNRNPNTDRGGGGGGAHHHQQRHHFNPPPPHDHSFGGSDGFRPVDDDGDGHSIPFSSRKRPFSASSRRDSADNIGYGKLYVGSIPKRATEDDIRPLFEEHGNVVEVIFIKDKWTGQQQGYCFVKFETLEEADRAIKALDNQYTLPGEFDPIVVRYADGKRDCLHNSPSAAETKLYVAGLNKHATEKEIEEIFSPYGCVEDIYILRVEMKQSRGSGFVKFSHRDMAVAAINALNGIHVMKGCGLPLIVRFADPKRPRAGEFRPDSNRGDPTVGHFQPNTRWKTNPQCSSSFSQAHDFASHSVAKPGAAPVPRIMSKQSMIKVSLEKPYYRALQLSVSEIVTQQETFPTAAQQNLRNSQTEGVPSTASQQKPCTPASQQECHQLLQQSLEQTSSQPSWTGTMQQDAARTHATSPTTAATSSTSSVLSSTWAAAHPTCEWSEHTCPDGFKYYYNCITKESRWEKPEAFTIFKQQQHKQLVGNVIVQTKAENRPTSTPTAFVCEGQPTPTGSASSKISDQQELQPQKMSTSELNRGVACKVGS